MNIFGFTTIEAVSGLIVMAFIGMIFGFLIGFLKFILFAFMQHKPSWSSWGSEAETGKGVRKYE
jgi:NhaP-type Na+/H+ or K+/H+ antiporter